MSDEKKCSCENGLAGNPSIAGYDSGLEESTKSVKEVDCGCGGKTKATDSECGCSESREGIKGSLQVVEAPRIYRERRSVKGQVVTVIDVTFSSSGIDLSDAWSRAMPRGEIHEIMLWNPVEEDDDAAAVAFIEITQGGNIVNGDEVMLDGVAFGNLAGFDYNHMPNHMNIVVETKSLKLPLKLGSMIEFSPNPMLLQLNNDCC